jgi:uncharacterized protein (UPF0261 family)
METVPERYRGRTLHVQLTVTLTHHAGRKRAHRTLDRRAAQSMDGLVCFYLPEGGVSALDSGWPF